MASQHHRALGSLFFLAHQEGLLWLLNAPVIGRWFRWVLRIHRDASSVGRRRIFRVIPNAIFWWQDGKQVAEFRTHAKFSKRLYYAFRPLWWALHAWDWLIADRLMPRLSFGFATLTAYPDADPETSTVDGFTIHAYSAGSGQSWSTLIAAVGSAAADADVANDWLDIKADTTSGNWQRLTRMIALFDTSSLTASAVISSAILSLYGAGANKHDDLSSTPNLDVYLSAPASNTALAAGDFDSFGSTSQTGSPVTYTNLSTSAYVDWTFNATGRSGINTTGISKYGFRNANYDVAALSPTWVSGVSSQWDAYCADQTGTTNDPKLVVTYTASVSITPPIGSLSSSGVASRNDRGIFTPTEVNIA